MLKANRCWAGFAIVALATPLGAVDVKPLLKEITAVGKEGKGNAEASRALRQLTAQGPEILLEVLAAMDDAGPVALNWLRAAVEAITDKTLVAGKPLPAAKLEAFVHDRRHSGPARRLAYECLLRVDADAPERLLPRMIDDPGAELRRDAVAVVLRDAQGWLDKKDRDAARAAFRKALKFARDHDQVKLAANQLKKLGVDIDLTAQFGFITQWMVIGPFDNSGGKGFHTIFPPEKGVDLKAAYKGKDSQQIRWREHTTEAPLGLVDFNKIYGEKKGVIGYAYARVLSPAERAVEIRAGSNNAVRIFVNGKEVFFREEYHHGMQMDQHRGRATLRAGHNDILIKVCQNEQTEEWTRLWSFQLRVSDDIGGAVPVTVVPGKAASVGGGEP